MKSSIDAAYVCLCGMLACILIGLCLPEARAEMLEDRLKDPDTFAICKTVDLASTAVILSHGGTELNPIMRGLFAHGWLPVIGISIGIWYWLHEAKNDTATEIANGITCGVAAHNLLVM